MVLISMANVAQFPENTHKHSHRVCGKQAVGMISVTHVEIEWHLVIFMLWTEFALSSNTFDQLSSFPLQWQALHGFLETSLSTLIEFVVRRRLE